jgi:probable HAF family extracellular repeat protein/YD repeat-containing protein
MFLSSIGGVQAYTYEPLDVPGAAATAVHGINDSNTTVGNFNDGSWHGFIYDGNTYTTLDVPAATATGAYGINDAGDIVGFYQDGSGDIHGFIYDGNTYTTLDVPGTTDTYAIGINDTGDIVGYYVDGSSDVHGFINNGNTYTPLDVPGAAGTYATGINDAGHIVGYYEDGSGDVHGFAYDGNTYTPLDVPGSPGTYARDINDSGDIVGYYLGSSFGFVLNNSIYTKVDVPDITDERLYGTNNFGTLVGYYDNGQHSFIGTPDPQDPTGDSYANTIAAATDLDPIGTYKGELFNTFDTDLNLDGPMPLFFGRYYASGLLQSNIISSLGNNWRHNFEWTLTNSGTDITIISNKGRLIEFTQNGPAWDLTGRTDIVYQLDENAGMFTLLDPRSGRMYTFNSAGTLIRIKDNKGNIHTLSYGGNLATVSDGLGRVLLFTYSGNKLSTVSDGSRTVLFSYTGNDLTQVTDVLGNNTSYAYYSGGLMTSSVLPEGNSPYTQTWNGSGQVASQTDSDGNTFDLAYNGQVTTLTGPLGNTRVHTHTATGEFSNRQDQAGQSFSMGSDATGRRNSLTDRLGDTTTIDYHMASGNVAAVNNGGPYYEWHLQR